MNSTIDDLLSIDLDLLGCKLKILQNNYLEQSLYSKHKDFFRSPNLINIREALVDYCAIYTAETLSESNINRLSSYLKCHKVESNFWENSDRHLIDLCLHNIRSIYPPIIRQIKDNLFSGLNTEGINYISNLVSTKQLIHLNRVITKFIEKSYTPIELAVELKRYKSICVFDNKDNKVNNSTNNYKTI